MKRIDTPNIVGAPGRQFSPSKYRIVTSRLLRAGMATDTTWFLGSPAKAFAYMENWPIGVEQSNENSEAGFLQDIVVRYKASERGAAATLEPRVMVKCTA